jgi:hypothetical protein
MGTRTSPGTESMVLTVCLGTVCTPLFHFRHGTAHISRFLKLVTFPSGALLQEMYLANFMLPSSNCFGPMHRVLLEHILSASRTTILQPQPRCVSHTGIGQ